MAIWTTLTVSGTLERPRLKEGVKIDLFGKKAKSVGYRSAAGGGGRRLQSPAS